MSGRKTWCKHYRAMYHHETCEAGVNYDQFKGSRHDDRPCFNASCASLCSSAEYMTPEEVKAYEAEIAERFGKTLTALDAINADAGLWVKGKGASGEIPCPVCKSGKLRYTRAGYNGHVSAACATEDCVAFMQ